MKYLKSYENIFNPEQIKIEVLTLKQFRMLYFKIYPDQNIDLKEKIHYFDYTDMNSMFASDSFLKTLRFITAYNDKDIVGICKFAHWEGSDNYAVSYLSTNKDYLGMGISKKILEGLYNYFSKKHPNEILHWSGYSIDGWKYLRKNVFELAKKYNIKLQEKAIEYITDWSDENRELMNKSKKNYK